ncbi:hypothetical protein [Subtercola boreus]|uniref:Uncharacterized protein n=1 Tax=Subtercola boreus TaxID=120213 RepID=A0A3E0W8L4_9MICO|nr:hypothetical protein [Subtercola boreus]RFA18143.1 hypothetical protein B7R24_15990 [Subtercola boreus]RFA18525.1 hypothetical protein B7R23_16025 [Subtercola boreus]RFA25053.1 hypothetical protein B7R25_16020 [Subtercola boreus]
MNISSLTSNINEALASHGGGPLVTVKANEGDEKSTVFGKLGGRDVRVEFTETAGSPDRGHLVALFDEQSGEQLGRGDSGANFADAIDGYSWNGALTALSELS